MKKKLLYFIFIFTLKITAQTPILHYPFDNNALDDSGNNYNGIIFGATFGSDRFGNPNSAVYFDGIDDYIEFPNITELKPDLPVSFSFFIKYDDLEYENSTVFNTSFEEDVNSGIYMNIQSSTGKYQISYGDGSNFYTSSSRRTYTNNSIIDNTSWHHIAIIVNSATDMKIYVDCVETGGTFSGTGGNLQYSTLPGNIGRHDRSLTDPADYFKGAIDDFKYWNRELNEQEVIDLCNTLDLNEFSLNDEFVTIYPNPTNGIINFETNNHNIDRLDIYNTLGQKVLSEKMKSSFNLSHLSKGIYIVKFYNETSALTKRIIIK